MVEKGSWRSLCSQGGKVGWEKDERMWKQLQNITDHLDRGTVVVSNGVHKISALSLEMRSQPGAPWAVG